MNYLIVFLLFFAASSWAGPITSVDFEFPRACKNGDCLLKSNRQRLYFNQDCVESYVLSNNETNLNFIYHASNSITTNNNYKVTSANNELILKAGNVIVFKPNSVIEGGSLFLAKIEPCIPCPMNFTYPKFFTPNGDNFNDTWKINWQNSSEFSPVRIFDRYGKLVKVLNNPYENWDGTYNTIDLSSTDYWFSIEYTDCNGKEKVYKSHFSLIR